MRPPDWINNCIERFIMPPWYIKFKQTFRNHSMAILYGQELPYWRNWYGKTVKMNEINVRRTELPTVYGIHELCENLGFTTFWNLSLCIANIMRIFCGTALKINV